MKKTTLNKIFAALYILNGIICLIYTEHVIAALPTICGAVVLAIGFVRFASGIKNRDYASLEGTDLERSLVPIAIGAGILFMQSEAIFIIGMFWGLAGLYKAAGSLNTALYKICRREKFLLPLLKSIAGFTLSLMLVFDPFGKTGHHVLILGLEMILEGSAELVNSMKKAPALTQGGGEGENNVNE